MAPKADAKLGCLSVSQLQGPAQSWGEGRYVLGSTKARNTAKTPVCPASTKVSTGCLGWYGGSIYELRPVYKISSFYQVVVLTIVSQALGSETKLCARFGVLLTVGGILLPVLPPEVGRGATGNQTTG